MARRVPVLVAVLCAGALVKPAVAAEAERYTPLPRAASPDARDSRSPEARLSAVRRPTWPVNPAPLAAPAKAAAETLAGTTSRPRQDRRSPDAARLAEIARSQERYYSSYGEPEPPAPPRSQRSCAGPASG